MSQPCSIRLPKLCRFPGTQSMRLARLILFIGLLQAPAPLLTELWEPKGSGGFGLHLVCLWSAILVGGLLVISFLAQLAGLLTRAYGHSKWNTFAHLATFTALVVGTLWLLDR